MTAQIEEADLKMLAYLSEHSGGHHERPWLDPKPVIRSLGLSQEQFATRSAHLVELGLAGVRLYAPDAVPAPSSRFCAIWLTGKGQDYIGVLETALGIGRRLTANVVKELWAKETEAISETAQQLFSELSDHPRRVRVTTGSRSRPSATACPAR